MRYSVVYDENAFGITCRSLKMLRDALAEAVAAGSSVAVAEVHTSEMTCGFFVFLKDLRKAVWTGDGFRTDRAGEGGAGYNTAKVLFRIYRITPVPIGCNPKVVDLLYQPDTDRKRILTKLAEILSRELTDSDFVFPKEKIPKYIRGVFL